MTTDLLAGDTALVTGAASGIGRGIAIAIAREGARVVLSDVDAQRGEETAAALRAEGRDARFLPSDLSTASGPTLLLSQAVEAIAPCPSSSTARAHAASKSTTS